jgi:type III pantothenate kinase
MQLVLDVGNTAIKAAWFSGFELLETEVLPEEADFDKLRHPRLGQPEKAIISSVRSSDPEWIGRLDFPLIRLNYQTSIPILNAYGSPQTLGMDRLANVVAAHQRFPHKNVLVLDTGTCLKCDFISSEGKYSGGSIAPGLLMRYQSMHSYTGKLPLLQPVTDAVLIGNDTAGSIHSGVLNGMLSEIEGMILRYKEMYPQLECVITGGDHPYFYHKLKSCIFAAPSLTLEGLNIILLHQQ